MNCNTCAIGITLLISSVFMTLLQQDKTIFIEFFDLLNDSQKQIYLSIVRERITAYVVGMISGIGVGLVTYMKYPKQPYPLCTFLTIVYLTKLGVYSLYPKSPLMLYSLTTKEQTDAWARIYEEMKSRYKLSLMIGFLGYVVLFTSLRK